MDEPRITITAVLAIVPLVLPLQDHWYDEVLDISHSVRMVHVQAMAGNDN